MLHRFASVAESFHREEIRFVVLKGADVITRLYGIHGTRPLADVDLLIDGADLRRIDRILLAQEFVRQIDGNPSYAASDRSLSLDLITDLWYLDEGGLAELWSRTATRPFLSSSARCLAPEDLLIHLTAYAVVHRGHLSSTFTEDLGLLLKQEPLDWPAVVSRVRSAQLEIPILHGLAHVRARRPAVAIPEHVFRDLAPVSWPQAAMARFVRRLVTDRPLPNAGHLLLFLTARRGTKFSWLRSKLCPSPEFLAYRYGDAPLRKPWRVRAGRWLHLCTSGFGLAVAMVRRLAAPPARAS
jgi:hypothetical protein